MKIRRGREIFSSGGTGREPTRGESVFQVTAGGFVLANRGGIGGGGFSQNFSTFVSVTNGELYLHRFEHNGDLIILKQKSHRHMPCFLHLLRCYTGPTRAVLGPWPEYINNTVNTLFVGLKKRGLHILEHSQFLYTSAFIPRVSALMSVRHRQCKTFLVTFL